MCDSTSGSPNVAGEDAVATLLIDNDRTRVTEWRFARRGSHTGWHRHEYDYVVVPLFNGVLEIDLGKVDR